MRKLLGIGAVVFGVVGVLLCTAAGGVSFWAAATTAARLDRVAARLDRGLADVDSQLARVESRVNAVRVDINAGREAAETIAAENPDLTRVRSEIERLLDRLAPTFERADALADSLRSVAAGLRTVADIAHEFNDNPQTTVRTRSAAERIERAAESLNGLGARVEALKSAKSVPSGRELVTLVREAIAGSERLAEGLVAARQDIAVVRGRTSQWRDEVVSGIYIAATASAFIWFWGGLGQLCLIGWGRRQFAPLT